MVSTLKSLGDDWGAVTEELGRDWKRNSVCPERAPPVGCLQPWRRVGFLVTLPHSVTWTPPLFVFLTQILIIIKHPPFPHTQWQFHHERSIQTGCIMPTSLQDGHESRIRFVPYQYPLFLNLGGLTKANVLKQPGNLKYSKDKTLRTSPRVERQGERQRWRATHLLSYLTWEIGRAGG
jgi:hypothetical protein